MFRRLLISCVICCSINQIYGQQSEIVEADSTAMIQSEDSEYPDEEEITDTTLYIHKIALSEDTLNAWKMNRKFAWAKNLDSLLKARQQKNVNASKKKTTGTSLPFLYRILTSKVLHVFLWILAIGFVLFIIYRLFINNGIFKKSTAENAVTEINLQPELLLPSDYDRLIHQSFKLGDYRMAVRYLFLKTLRQLADKGHLHQSAEKTNFQYVQEISPVRKKDFASLVLNYEYVWYGHFDINRDQYDQIEKKYVSFYNKI